MTNFLKISEAASLGMHTMTLLAQEDRRLSTQEIARRLEVSEHHLAKVMQRLGRVGLVKSTRGPQGGFVLSRPPEEVSLLEVFEAVEGPVGEGQCLLGRPRCDRSHCVMGDLIQSVQSEVTGYFGNTTLASFIRETEKQQTKG